MNNEIKNPQINNEELILKSIEKRKSYLQFIRNKYDVMKTEHDQLQNEIQSMQLKEAMLKDAVNQNDRAKNKLIKEYEKICLQIEEILWRKRILTLKLENEKNKRNYYENIMHHFSPVKPDFLNIDEYQLNLETKNEKEILINKIKLLTEEIENKKKSTIISDETKLIQYVQRNPSKKLKWIRRSIKKVEMIIRNKEEELQHLTNEL